MIKQVDFNYQDIEKYNTIVLCYLNHYVDPIHKSIKRIETSSFSALECSNYNNAMLITDWNFEIDQNFNQLKEQYNPNFLLNFTHSQYNNQTLDQSVEFKENYKYMKMDLAPAAKFNIDLANNVEIIQVKEQEDLNSFLYVVDIMEVNLVSDKNKFIGLLELQDYCHMFLIKVNGQVAGTGSIFMFENGYAVVDDINVLPEFRNQGLASNLIKTIVNDCIEHNMQHVLLFASEMGMGLYQRVGFIDEDFWFEQYKIK
ncbi:GNAT family N-acetyltransferase [Spiroplasma culicicola]|uniref:N-acetyltransferase domain-containing protein n=1 Tax=Spiroplasma culicicola AES-1 TaxID=1276246 RepID=W6A7T0_9MOLU|nr:GNAT family N-acetyltransferase [Spiroplasma culicicola]AHI53046.1 hypothetical protein SCULI_v1c07050 [Spiroplasma culicicola AES-1]